MKQLKILNLENATDEEEKIFGIRDTARAVIFDERDNVALMKSSLYGFYKIPGGGVDEGETVIEALHRECMEEAGVEIEIWSELGLIKEVRKMYEKVQNSYCYVAHTKGEKKQSQLTKSEQSAGLGVIWVSLDEAIRLVECVESFDQGGEYRRDRELTILRAAQEFKNKG